jgi:DNA-binding LytR/AlgR family response regulator
MPTPTALLAEDEAVLRKELRARLARLWPALHICAEAQNGLEAVALMERHRPDVVFLDIEMPGMSGLDVARHASGRSHVAFITAFDAHAVAAFEQGAIDYVLKPYDDARLELTIERVKQRLGSRPPEIESLLHELTRHAPRRDYLRWINASVGNDVRLITVDEICYFQAGAGYTRVFTPDRECLIRLSLKELAEQLDPACFWMIHRSTIVNANAISGVTRDLRGRLAVKLKSRPDKLAVSEAHERLFRQM